MAHESLGGEIHKDEIVRLAGNLPPFLLGRYAWVGKQQHIDLTRTASRITVCFWDGYLGMEVPNGQWRHIAEDESARVRYATDWVEHHYATAAKDPTHGKLVRVGRPLVTACSNLSADAPLDCVFSNLALYPSLADYLDAWGKQRLLDRDAKSQTWHKAIRLANFITAEEERLFG